MLSSAVLLSRTAHRSGQRYACVESTGPFADGRCSEHLSIGRQLTGGPLRNTSSAAPLWTRSLKKTNVIMVVTVVNMMVIA